MKKLARGIVGAIIDGYGSDVLLRRLADPLWFQSLGCCLGYDWHSSGVTTVLTGVLKHSIDPEEHGLAVAGGKGRLSRQVPREIENIVEVLDLSQFKLESLLYASKMSAKVDNTAVQSGYPLYHHAFFVDERGEWTVIQQGINVEDRNARRYHWLSEDVGSFVEEPGEVVVCDVKRSSVLNMVADESSECRKASTDLVKDGVERVKRLFFSLKQNPQSTLEEWLRPENTSTSSFRGLTALIMPRRINWNAVKRAYEVQPENYEELLGVKGMGPATVRGLALVSEMIYGSKPSWRDPVKYSFTVGGKDGVPYPVDRRSNDEIIEILGDAVAKAKIGDRERLRSLERLSRFLGTE
jgi:hypothetical protein